MLIKIKNNLDNSAPYSYLSFGEVSGTTSWRVQNINSFSANWAVQAGKTGEDQTEIKLLSGATPSGTALTLATASTYEHPADTPLYAIKFDKVIFKRSVTGTAGTATSLATVNLTPDQQFTQYDDTSGAATYAYKAAYFNSSTNEISADSDWLTPSGFTFYSLAKIRDRVKRKLFDSGYIKDDSTIDDWINEWLEIMNGAAIKVNKDYVEGTVDIAISSTTGLGTITPTDFKEARRIDFTQDGISFFMATKMARTSFLPTQTFVVQHPYYYYQGDNVLGMMPFGGTARIVYYKIVPVLVNDTDELPVSMHLYTKSFVDWGVAQALWVDGKDDRAQVREKLAYQERDRFINEITPRSFTGAVLNEIVEPTSGQDDEGYY